MGLSCVSVQTLKTDEPRYFLFIFHIHISCSYFIFIFHVHISYSYFMFIFHVHISYSYFMFIFHIHIHIHISCSYFIIIFHISYSYFVFIFHIHISYSLTLTRTAATSIKLHECDHGAFFSVICSRKINFLKGYGLAVSYKSLLYNHFP